MERYKLEIVNDHGDRYIRCEPATDGSWVMFKDVAALEARIAELEAILGQLLDAQSPTLEVVRRIGRAVLERGKE